MDERELLASADERIRAHRTSEVTLCLVDRAGAPLPHVDAEVRLVDHAFRWGCNAFQIGQIGDRALQDSYEQRYAELLNYATLPFYWGGYEPHRGVKSEERLRRMAGWCDERRIATKGHPLVWHEVYPPWAEALGDAEAVSLLEERVHEIVGSF